MRIFLGIIGGLVLLGGIIVGVFVIQWGTAPVRGKLSAREQIQSGSNRIVSYNHFFDLCASIQATEAVLSASLDELKSTSNADDKERVRTNITGLRAQRARSIAQYNVDARKNYTIGQFRSSSLPYQLPPNYKKGMITSCEA